MGWMFETLPSTKSSYVQNLLKENFSSSNSICTLIAYSLQSNNLWTVVKPKNQDPIIILFRLQCQNKCWGYKDMDESMGPYYYDCPLRFFDLAPEPPKSSLSSHKDSGFTWRDFVRQYHLEKHNKHINRPKIGDSVTLCSKTFPDYKLIYKVTNDLGRKGLLLNNYLRIKSNQIQYLNKVISVI